MFRSSRVVAALLSGFVAGCLIATDDYAGKPCESDEDCPRHTRADGTVESFYTCVVYRADGFKSCEVIFPPRPVLTGGAFPPTYCSHVKPILDRSCLANCHSTTDTSGSQRDDFVLDRYDGVAGKNGAKAMAARIKLRTVDCANSATLPGCENGPMPPPGGTTPTPEEMQVLTLWAGGGAPYADGGTDLGFCGGGTVDAGASCLDGGMISLSRDLLPKWNGFCTPCHTTRTDGQLNLGNRDGGTYQDLINRPTVAPQCLATVPVRVAPGNPMGSSLYRKVIDTTCGPKMPSGGVTLPACEIEMMRAWIAQGAQNN
ncbi:MAG: hypothetical protein ACOZIN_06945 [Myxococcota bacterium]